MKKDESKIIEFLYGTDNFLFKQVDEVTDSELETFVMACWRCFMTNAQWLLLFHENEQLVPYWQIAFTLRLLIETVADLRYVLADRVKASEALNKYKNFPTLTDEDFVKELRKLRGGRKEREKSLLNCNIGEGNVARVEKMLDPEYADTYVLLCDFNHCNYCGISIAANPTKQLTELRRSSIDLILKLCKIMRDTLPQYEKFNNLPDWLDTLSDYKNSKNKKISRKESDDK